jgi:hypothetical protein
MISVTTRKVVISIDRAAVSHDLWRYRSCHRRQMVREKRCRVVVGGYRDRAGGGYSRASFLAELGASRREQCTSAIGELEFCLAILAITLSIGIWRRRSWAWWCGFLLLGLSVCWSLFATSARADVGIRGDQGDLRDLFMCRRGYLGSLAACAAKTFLMELRRAYEKLRPIQRPDRLIAWLPKDSRLRQLGRQSV